MKCINNLKNGYQTIGAPPTSHGHFLKAHDELNKSILPLKLKNAVSYNFGN
jgi:hypothetical protein